jgi:hypothetical protein
MKMLKEDVEHHADEEEKEMFKEARKMGDYVSRTWRETTNTKGSAKSCRVIRQSRISLIGAPKSENRRPVTIELLPLAPLKIVDPSQRPHNGALFTAQRYLTGMRIIARRKEYAFIKERIPRA